MDWFSWLSKTGLEPSLVYEYGLALTHNELEEVDIAYFNHDFLQSMGISIAKHRLEILKLARRKRQHPMSKLIFLFKKTKNSLINCISKLVHGDEGRALIVAPNKGKNEKTKSGAYNSYSSRWKKAMILRNNGKNYMNKFVIVNHNCLDFNEDRLRLTNGDDLDLGDDHVSTPNLENFYSPLMYDLHHQSMEEKAHDNQENGYLAPPIEEAIRWDAMFHNLKPT